MTIISVGHMKFSQSYWKYYGSEDLVNFDQPRFLEYQQIAEKLDIPIVVDYGISGSDRYIDDPANYCFDDIVGCVRRSNDPLYQHLPYRVFVMKNDPCVDGNENRWKGFLSMAPVDRSGKVLWKGIPSNCFERLDPEHQLKVRIEWEDLYRDFVVPAVLQLIAAKRSLYHRIENLLALIHRQGKQHWHERNLFQSSDEYCAYASACQAVENAESVRGAKYTQFTLTEILEIYNSSPVEIWEGIQGNYVRAAGLAYTQASSLFLLNSLLSVISSVGHRVFWESDYSKRKVVKVDNVLVVESW